MKHLKRLLLLTITLLMAVAASAYDFSAKNEDGVEIYYNISGNQYAVVTFYGNNYYDSPSKYVGEVAIPETVEYNGVNYTVQGIGEGAFYCCSKLTKISLPNSIDYIWNYAFEGCTSLAEVEMPRSSLSFIGVAAFQDCSALKRIDLLGVGTIMQQAFAGAGLEYVATAAKSIESYAFAYCPRLKSVALYAYSSLYLGSNCFAESSVEEISIGCDVVGDDRGMIIDGVFSGLRNLKRVTLRDGVTRLMDNMFKDCENLNEITLSKNLSSIGNNTFSGCTNLKRILNYSSLPLVKGSTDYGYVAFYAENILNNPWEYGGYIFDKGKDGDDGTLYYYRYTEEQYLWLPDNCDGKNYIIAPNAFHDCTNVLSVVIPNSVTAIGDNAFPAGKTLGSLWVGANVKSVGQNALPKDIDKVMWLPKTAPAVAGKRTYVCSDNPFAGNYIKLDHLDTWFYSYGIYYVELDPEQKTCMAIDGSYNDIYETHKIPENPTRLGVQYKLVKTGDYLFSRNPTMEKLEIGFDIKDLGVGLAYGCSKLKTVGFAYDIENIRDSAFCYSTLPEFNIPKSIKNIEQKAFYGCYWLKRVYNYSDLQIEKGSTDNGYVAYYADVVAKNPVFDGDFLFDEDIDNDRYRLVAYKGNDTDLTLPKSCNGKNYTIAEQAFSNNTKIQSVTIPGSVTRIEASAFYNCKALAKIQIPQSVTYIGKGTFQNCSSLTSINLPSSLPSIEPYTFSGCSKLQEVYFPNKLTNIGDNAFAYCAFNELTIKKSVESIGSSAFFRCSSLKTLTIEDSSDELKMGSSNFGSLETLYLGRNVNGGFSGDSNLSSVTIGNMVTRLPNRVFSDCYALADLTIPNTVKEIGSYAFQHCPIYAITLPNSVTTLGSSVFYECKKLAKVTWPSSLSTIPSYTFAGCTSLPGISLPKEVTVIERYAFKGCTLLSRFVVSESITSIEDMAFYDCINLSYVENHSKLRILKGSTDNGYVAYYATEVVYPGFENDEDFLFDNNGTNGGYRLARYIGISPQITLPASHNGQKYEIAADAFKGCGHIRSITIPNSSIDIPRNTFSDCTELASLWINTNVGNIYKDAFPNTVDKVFWLPNTAPAVTGKRTYVSTSNASDVQYVKMDYLSSWFEVDGVKYVLVSPSERTCIAVDCSYATSCVVMNIPEIVTYRNREFKVLQASDYLFSRNNTVKEISVGFDFKNICESFAYKCNNLEKVSFAYNVETIGNNAFYGTKLVSADFLESVETIGDNAFRECSGLETLVIGENTSKIGENAFNQCIGIKNLYYNARNCTTSNSGPFTNSRNISYLKIGETVDNLPRMIFSYISFLKTVEFAGSVNNIGNGAFYNDNYLKKVKTRSIWDWCRIKFEDSSSNPLWYANHLYLDDNEITDLVIPDDISVLNDYVFCGGDGFQTLNLNHVQEIGKFAFEECQGLSELYLPACVKTVGAMAFYNCSGLTKMDIANGVSRIDHSAFYDCSSLKEIALPNSLITLGSYAFGDCTALQSAKIGNSLQTLEYSLFVNCESLVSVTFGNNVTKIEGSVFKNCTSLPSIVIPNTVTSLGTNVFENCKALATAVIGDKVAELKSKLFYNCESLKNVIIGQSVTRIGEQVFEGCSALVSLTIPECVNSIGNQAFNSCSSLTKLTLEDGKKLLTLGYKEYSNKGGLRLFSDCPLQDVYLGRDITYNESASYGYSPFYNASTLRAVTVGPEVTEIGNYLFQKCTALENLTLGNSLTTIKDYAFAECSTLTTVAFPRSLKTIGNYSFANDAAMTSVTIPNAVTSIGEYSFSCCSNVEKLTLGLSLENIGSYAFTGAEKLESVAIPNKVVSLGDYSFNNCTSLKDVAFEDGNTPLKVDYKTHVFNGCPVESLYLGRDLNSELFSGKKTLTSLTIGNTVTSLPRDAFGNCTGLTEVALPGSMKTVKEDAFYGCSSVKTLEIHDGIGTLDIASGVFNGCPLEYVMIGRDLSYKGYTYSPFAQCQTLKTAWITDMPTGVGDYLFYDCENLENVYVGDNVVFINKYAFSGCKNLSLFNFGKKVESIGDEAFSDCTGMRNLYAEADVPPICGAQAFDDINRWDCTLHVPTAQNSAYAQAPQWKDFLFVDNDFALYMSAAAISLEDGQTCQLSVTQTDGSAADNVVWKSSNPFVAEVDQKGLVRVTGEGHASIAAFSTAGQIASCEINGQASSAIPIVAADGNGNAFDGTYRVYNMNGALILKTTSKADLNSLPRGLYIINGKKVQNK